MNFRYLGFLVCLGITVFSMTVQAGLLISSSNTDTQPFLNLTNFDNYVHFTADAPIGSATLGGDGIPFNAVSNGSQFSNFSDTFGGSFPNGEVSDQLNPHTTSLRYGPEVSDISQSYWFGGWGESDGVNFDFTLPSADGVLQVFAGGFGSQGASLSAGLDGNVVSSTYNNPYGFSHWGNQYTLIWTNEQAGDVIEIDFNNIPEPGYGNAGLVGMYAATLPELVGSYTSTVFQEAEAIIQTPLGNITQTLDNSINTVLVSNPTGLGVVTSSNVDIETEMTQSVDYLIANASTAVRTKLGRGVNKIDIEASTTNAGLLTPIVEASSGWEDLFVVYGGEGTGIAELQFRVHGELSADDFSALQYQLIKRDLMGVDADVEDLIINYSLSSTTTPSGEFVTYLTAEVEFDYGLPFYLSSELMMNASLNGQALFGQSIELELFIVPDGAQVTSAGILNGQVEFSDYGIQVPIPPIWMLILAGLLAMHGWRKRIGM